MRYCQKCGNPVGENAGFCQNCGAPVLPQQQPRQQAQQNFYQPPYNPSQQVFSQNQGNGGVKPMDFGTALKKFFQNYANFEGRARRAEYWWPYLAVMIAVMIASMIGVMIGCCIPFLNILVGLATMIPIIAAGVRRLHDLGKSGLYYLFVLIPVVGGIILLIWFAQEGQRGPNEYGEDPKYY